jgi:hypothetical protein
MLQIADGSIALPVDTKRHLRRDAQRAFYADGTAVYQVLTDAFSTADFVRRGASLDDFVVLLTGTHLRPSDDEDLAWVFSTNVPMPEGEDDAATAALLAHWPKEEPWVISTHQIEQFLGHSAQLRGRVLGSMLLYCILGNGVGIEPCCESSPCALNNCDSVGEGAATSLLLCPCCLRKLQLAGVISDVPATLRRVKDVLSGPELRGVSEHDLQLLREWGY